MPKLFQELKRRKVLTTNGVSAGAAFIIIQVAEIVFPRLFIPDWAVTFVIVMAILGFPITFFLSWTYDLKREADAGDKLDDEDGPQVKKTKKILRCMVVYQVSISCIQVVYKVSTSCI